VTNPLLKVSAEELRVLRVYVRRGSYTETARELGLTSGYCRKVTMRIFEQADIVHSVAVAAYWLGRLDSEEHRAA
jgi:hypothetical protein